MQDENIEVTEVKETNQQEDEEFTKEQFDVTSEIVEDFDYFYTDEDKILENEKIKKRHRLFIGLIIALLVFITTMAVGGTRMIIYNTQNVVTREFVKRKDYCSLVENPYKYVFELINFSADGETQNGILTEIDYTKNSSLEKINDINTKLNEYKQSESSFKNLPVSKGDSLYTSYSDFSLCLTECINIEYDWTSSYISYMNGEMDEDTLNSNILNYIIYLQPLEDRMAGYWLTDISL